MLKLSAFTLFILVVLAVASSVQAALKSPHAEKLNKEKKKTYRKNVDDAVKKVKDALGSKVKHFVVFEFENRAANHVFGARPGFTPFFNPNEFNYISTLDHSKGMINASISAKLVPSCDPCHGFECYDVYMYGLDNMMKLKFGGNNTVSMGGFVEGQVLNKHCADNNYCDVMAIFNSTAQLPTLTAFADEFAIFDRFYTSYPGPTWPNRQMTLAGTSNGNTDTAAFHYGIPGLLYPAKTILDQVVEAGGTAQVVIADTPWELFMASIADHPERVIYVDDFLANARNGYLPDFAYINPSSGVNISCLSDPTKRDFECSSSDWHPAHPAGGFELFLKQVYDGIRVSPLWNQTALIIVADEGGGYYDPFIPENGFYCGPECTNDKDYIIAWDDPLIKFSRFGPRIPFLVASPWIPKGLVVHEAPDSQKPFLNSQYEHTSIMSTALKMLPILNGSKPLTKRAAWSSTFEHIFSLDEPRTDCIMELPLPLPDTMSSPNNRHASSKIEAQSPMTDLQKEMLQHHIHALTGRHNATLPSHIKTQGQVSSFAQDLWKKHKTRVATWKGHKEHIKKVKDHVVSKASQKDSPPSQATGLHVAVVPDGSTPFWVLKKLESTSWLFRFLANASETQGTISILINNTRYCLDGGSPLQAGNTVGVSLCFPSSDPTRNRDPAQNFVIRHNRTIGPGSNSNLCMTTTMDTAKSIYHMTLEYCTQANSMFQHFGYHGRTGTGGRKSDGQGVIFFGDDTNSLGVWTLA